MAEPPKPDEKTGITYWNPENIEHFPGRRLGSFFANRTNFLLGTQVTRVVFGEALVSEEDATWYSAVTMPTDAWVDLAKNILHV
jgi:hypothetical protein